MKDGNSRSREILACIADASRFRIVHALLEREQCVTELAESVGLSQSCTTRHLQYLGREGVVARVRQGKRVMFRLRSDLPRVRELLAWVTASPGEAGRGRISGASVHVESPVPAPQVAPQADGAPGRGRTTPRPGSATRSVGRVPPPAPAAGRSRDPVAERPDPTSQGSGAPNPGVPEMEDWLL
ncbi:MAG TPA: metalloregulator ArsR/SmtB family transcription factor [Candidatus Eisenbacteria bacterium]|jgi:DNA-binding transcriptional ArsR family regulator